MISRRTIGLIAVCLLLGAVLIAAADSKADKKAKADQKAKDAKEAKEKKAAARRGIADWKMTDKDYRELEDLWMEDEEEEPEDEKFKWRKGPNGERMPPDFKQKMEMGFATLTPGTTKDQTETIAKRWSQLLSTDGTDVKCYAIEDDKILVGVDAGVREMIKVKAFVMDQKELWEFEWQQQKSLPPHRRHTLTAEEKAAELRQAKEAELRRKLESGELFAEKLAKEKAAANKGKAKAKTGAAGGKQKDKQKVKAAAKAKPEAKTADKPKAKDEL